MKKFLAIFLVAVILLSFTSCSEKKGGATAEKDENISKVVREQLTLLYSTSDSFNPYESITDQNRQITKLIFEPLVKVDNQFDAVYCLAKDIKIESVNCTVTIKDTVFSDGTPLTADDVVYSYNAAVQSGGLYAYKLYEVKSCSAVDSKTVLFTLNKVDPYFANVLDFPIFKSGSDKLTDGDSVKLVPIGCGKFVFNDEKTELLPNVKYHGKQGIIKKIRLINAPDFESVAHYVEIGAVDIYFNDISDGEIVRMSGQKMDVNLNNLVYIGVNHSVGELSQVLLRQAISSGIDRTSICGNAYFNNALPAEGFFSPVWDTVKSVQNIQTSPNLQITIENLEEIGYNNLDSEGIRYNGGRSLRYSLLVNNENRSRLAAAELIAEQLKQVGIEITVVAVNFAEYQRRLQNGEFQLYLGEVKFTDNMDVSSLVIPGASAAYGVQSYIAQVEEGQPVPANAADIVSAFYKGEAVITDVVSALQSEMPVIPVCYRTGVLFCKDGIDNINGASQNDIFLNIG